jgi:glycosyltransferase involved in cell wall biosynthesis
MKKRGLRILVLSFYYPPDLSAGSFRTSSLVAALQKNLPEGSHVDVFSTLPNRYSSFLMNAPEEEHLDNLTVRRVRLPAHQSGIFDQSRAFITYWRQVTRFVAANDYDLVFGTSSRLMTAVLAARVACMKNSALYLDIRDIFVDTLADVFPRVRSLVLTPLFSQLEKWTVRRADKVNLISRGFSSYFQERYPFQSFSYFTNGIDAEFLNVSAFSDLVTQSKPVPTVLYAGNVGEGQGLHRILPRLAKKMRGRVLFKVIGDGGRLTALKEEIASAGVDNVVFSSPVERDVLIAEYADADILFLHLNDFEAFKKVLPSKLFEYAATGKPIWAGVSGHAAEFIGDEVKNAQVFPPCDELLAVQAFEKLNQVWTDRSDFVGKFSRSNIMNAMAQDVCSVAAQGKRG